MLRKICVLNNKIVCALNRIICNHVKSIFALKVLLAKALTITLSKVNGDILRVRSLFTKNLKKLTFERFNCTNPSFCNH